MRCDYSLIALSGLWLLSIQDLDKLHNSPIILGGFKLKTTCKKKNYGARKKSFIKSLLTKSYKNWRNLWPKPLNRKKFFRVKLSKLKRPILVNYERFGILYANFEII